MFFTGTGFYLSTMITIWSVSIFVLCHLVLTLTGSAQYDQYIWNNDPAAKSVGGGGHGRQLDTVAAARQLNTAARQLDDGAPTSQEMLLSCVAAGQQWLCATAAGPGDTGGAGVSAEAPFGEGPEEAEYIVATWQAATYSAVYLLHLGLLLVLPFVMELWLELDLRQALSYPHPNRRPHPHPHPHPQHQPQHQPHP